MEVEVGDKVRHKITGWVATVEMINSWGYQLINHALGELDWISSLDTLFWEKVDEGVKMEVKVGDRFIWIGGGSHRTPFRNAEIGEVTRLVTRDGCINYEIFNVTTQKQTHDYWVIPSVLWEKVESHPLQGTTFEIPEEVNIIYPPKCECGATAINSQFHSDWCPLYRGDQWK